MFPHILSSPRCPPWIPFLRLLRFISFCYLLSPLSRRSAALSACTLLSSLLRFLPLLFHSAALFWLFHCSSLLPSSLRPRLCRFAVFAVSPPTLLPAPLLPLLHSPFHPATAVVSPLHCPPPLCLHALCTPYEWLVLPIRWWCCHLVNIYIICWLWSNALLLWLSYSPDN